MVNTFLVDKDFRVSASKLDNLRLGKQRVESYQILIALTQLRFLAKLYNIPDYPIGLDTAKNQRQEWINTVLSTFKQSGYVAILRRGNELIYYQVGQTLPHKCASGNKLLYNPATQFIYEVKGKKEKVVTSGPWHTFVLPGDELITTGFRKHPAVCLWLGFEESLKQYINAHIEAWISRGKNNTMKTYTVCENVPRPSWTLSDEVINNFKSSLVQKEIERHEKSWYLTQSDFVEAWSRTSDHSKQLNEFIKQLPDNAWWKYVDDKILLTFGNFAGYIWS
jgi:hypothetical protein